MSRLLHHGFLPSWHFSTEFVVNSSIVPRSYNSHSSDESETGGGGSSYTIPPASHESSSVNQNPRASDVPFIPRRTYSQLQPSKELIIPPENLHLDYRYPATHRSGSSESYDGRPFPGVQYNVHSQQREIYPGTASDRHLPFPQDYRRLGNEQGQWNVSSVPEFHGYLPQSTGQDILSATTNFPVSTMSGNIGHYGSFTDSPPSSLPSGFDSRHQSPGVFPIGFRCPGQVPSTPGSDTSSPSSDYSFTMRTSSGNVSSGYNSSAFQSLPDTQVEAWLRSCIGIPNDRPVNLWYLPDPPPGQRPSQSHKWLMALAIHGSPQRRLTLKGIYAAIEERFTYYRDTPDLSWQGSMRHSLSLYSIFQPTSRPISEPGKGGYWVLDLSHGDGYKRPRKRKSKKEKPDTPEEDDEMSDDGSSSSVPKDNQQDRFIGRIRTPKIMSPYPSHPYNIQSSPFPAGHAMAISPAPTHTHMDPPQSPVFGQAGFQSSSNPPTFGQPSLGPNLRSRSQPVSASDVQHAARHPPSRASTLPAPGTYGPLEPLRSVSTRPVMGVGEMSYYRDHGTQGSSEGHPISRSFQSQGERDPTTSSKGSRKGKGRAV